LTSSPQGRIASLDGIRAISISLVLFGHLLGTHNFLTRHAMAWAGDLSAFGVRVFFVISGYLITRLLLAEYARYGAISLSRFYLRRTFRIFPAFYALLAFLAAARALGWLQVTNMDLLRAGTFTINYMPDRSWEVGHLWSLAVEEQFYLLWPALMAMAGIHRSLTIAAWTVALSPLLRIVILIWIPSLRPGLGEAFHAVADPLATGCLLAGLEGWISLRPGWRQWLGSPPAAWLPLAPLLLNLVPGTKLGMLVIQSVQNAAIAAALLRLVWFPDTPLGRLLNAPSVRFVGVLSYSLYLWQQVFLNRTGQNEWNHFPVNLLAAMACGLLSYFLIERPSLAWRETLEQRWLGVRRALPASPGN
jgi:peptidoglycan/LPS O-acetylase OafA/YrhL